MKILSIALLALLHLQVLSAQVNPTPSYSKPLHFNSDTSSTEDEYSIAGSLDNKSFKKRSGSNKKWLVLGGTALWATTFLVFDEPIRNFAQDSRSSTSNDIFKTIEPLGRTKYLVSAASASLLGGLAFKNKKMRDAGVISVASLLANSVITNTLKDAFRRHRPSTSVESDQFDGPFVDTRNSALPSSHTSNAFALATSVAYVYSDSKIVPPLAYGLATLVGVSRIHDNAHWTTDVAAGAAVGFLTAKGVIHLHKWVDQKIKNKQKMKLMITPVVTHQSIGIHSTISF